jgi:hypothetical protein
MSLICDGVFQSESDVILSEAAVILSEAKDLKVGLSMASRVQREFEPEILRFAQDDMH